MQSTTNGSNDECKKKVDFYPDSVNDNNNIM